MYFYNKNLWVKVNNMQSLVNKVWKLKIFILQVF